VPAAPLTSSLQDPRVLAFLLVLFGVNLLFGLSSISMADCMAGAYRRVPCRSPGIRRIDPIPMGRRPE